MIKTLLFDLDGTLLPMDMDDFIKHYFLKLTNRFQHLMPPQEFIALLMRSTEAMIRSNDAAKTNEEVFVADFFRDFPRPAQEIMPLFEDFYQSDFRELKSVVGCSPAARAALDAATAKGYALVVATNPLFPRLAITERLRWAQIDDYPWELVTTYEEMHFCKPNPEYYREILGRLGLKPAECLMIGNDVEEDLIARRLGIKTFLVEDCLLNPRRISFETDYRGSLQDLAEFIGQELPAVK